MQSISTEPNMRTFKIIISILIPLMLGLAVVAGCSSRSTDKPVITVSIQPQKYLLDQIVGDKIDVKCLLSNGGNPESYDPSFTHLMNVDRSLAYLRVGNVGFEEAILGRIQESNPNLKIVNTSEGITLIEGTHDHGKKDDGHHHDIDPHTWSSVKNARIIARNMLEAIKNVDPSNSKYYQANFERFDARLDSLDKAYATVLAPHRGESFLVMHPSLSYLARDYGLNQVSVNKAGKESSISSIQATIDRAKAGDAKVIFVQKELDSRQAESIIEGINATRVDINPLTYDWETEMTRIVNALSTGGEPSDNNGK